MSIDITIKQKGFTKKTLPLEVILGHELAYGFFDGLRLEPGELGDSEFLAYHPEHIARGISIIWTPSETKQVALRSLSPSTSAELRDLYAMVRRITEYWNCALTVDGNKVKPEVFQNGLADMAAFNAKVLNHMTQKILSGEQENITLYSAMWPITMGKQEAEIFARDPDSFASWLHEKQSIDVYYAKPSFEMTEDGTVLGHYALTEDVRSIFPLKPYVPFGYVNPNTNKALECDQYDVSIYSITREAVIGTIEYGQLIESIDPAKKSRFDDDHLLIEPLTLDELMALPFTQV